MSRALLRAGGAGAALVIGLGLTACGSSAAEEVDISEKTVGAMEDFAAGEQFTATEALSFPILYSEHPNYPTRTASRP